MHHEQDFVVIAVDLNVTRFAQLERNRPLDRAGFPARRQVPFDLGWDAGVARELPIGVPPGRHFQEEAGRKWLDPGQRPSYRRGASL